MAFFAAQNQKLHFLFVNLNGKAEKEKIDYHVFFTCAASVLHVGFTDAARVLHVRLPADLFRRIFDKNPF